MLLVVPDRFDGAFYNVLGWQVSQAAKGALTLKTAEESQQHTPNTLLLLSTHATTSEEVGHHQRMGPPQAPSLTGNRAARTPTRVTRRGRNHRPNLTVLTMVSQTRYRQRDIDQSKYQW